MRRHLFALAALGAALSFTVPLAARAADAGPDYKEHCKKAAAKKAGVKGKDIKVVGKHKNSDGYMVVDFSVTDGRKGQCLCEGNGKVYDVSLEGTATQPPASTTKKK